MKPWQLAAIRGVLPQASTISFPFTVREIVRMGLTAGLNLHPDKSDRRRRPPSPPSTYRLRRPLLPGTLRRRAAARAACPRALPDLQALVDGKPCWLLLDEPVLSLDISHQLSIMSLTRTFYERGGGVIAVMHNLNLAALFADRIVLMKSGWLTAAGSIEEVMTDATMLSVFGCALRINQIPADGTAFVLAHSALSRA